MRFSLRLFLLSTLFLCGVILLGSSSHYAFAAQKTVTSSRTLSNGPDSNPYLKAYIDGFKQGYDAGVERCVLDSIENPPEFSFSQGADQQTVEGMTKGFDHGFTKGQEDCQAQLRARPPSTPVPLPPSTAPFFF